MFLKSKDNNIYFEFRPSKCYVKSQGTNKVLLEGTINSEGLYSFDNFKLHQIFRVTNQIDNIESLQQSSSTFQFPQTLFSVSSCNDFMLWHKKRGHVNERVVRFVLNSCNMKISNKQCLSSCTACIYAKAHKQPSPPFPTIYCKPLELLYCDLWGSSPLKSRNGSLYYLSIIDA